MSKPFSTPIDDLFGMAYTGFKRYQLMGTAEFDQWLLRQPIQAQTIIRARFERISLEGHFGFINRFEDLIELKWTSGLRIYTFKFENRLVIAIGGGNKNGQEKDIKKAKKIRDSLVRQLRTR